MTPDDDAKTGTEPPHHLGHRRRLRERFLRDGGAAMADYELLELLLCLAVPRQDMKPLAKRLIATFGSYGAAISAPAEALRAVEGIGDAAVAALRLARASALRLIAEEATTRPAIGSHQHLIDYCRAELAHSAVEEFYVLFLDAKNGLIKDERQTRGTVNHAPVYPREVVKRALELGASALILVHNHPSGDPTPSEADVAMTRSVQQAAQALGISVHDHLVIGRHGHASLRALGKLT